MYKMILLMIWMIWFGGMTYLSHQQGSGTKELSMKLAGIFSPKNSEIMNRWLRCTAHVLLFFGLMVLTALLLAAFYAPWALLLLVIIWAWLDERTKKNISGRHYDWFDVRLNLLGCGLGILVVAIWMLH